MFQTVHQTLIVAVVGLSLHCSRIAEPPEYVPEPEPEWVQRSVADFGPSSWPTVRAMLEISGLRQGEVLYDVGSGDGRVVVTAAKDYGARSVGFELDPDLVAISRQRILALRLTSMARVEIRDLYTADFSVPDVVVAFLQPQAMERLRPLLEKQLRRGSRVVSNSWAIPGWSPSKTVSLVEKHDGRTTEVTIYMYRR